MPRPVRVSPNVNVPPPQQKQQQSERLTRFQLLQRFLQGDRRQSEASAPGSESNSLVHRRYPGPVDAFATPRPIMMFQGPLPPVITSKIASVSRREDKQYKIRHTDILDPVSASIVGGGSILGIPAQTPDSDERNQMQRMLFGSNQSLRPRSSSSGWSQFFR